MITGKLDKPFKIVLPSDKVLSSINIPDDLLQYQTEEEISLQPKSLGALISNCIISPDLPAGLKLSKDCALSGQTNQIIEGKPYTLTLTLTSKFNRTNVIPFALKIALNNKYKVPPTVEYAATAHHGFVGKYLHVAPTKFGGGEIQKCTISPALPAELSWNDATCVVTGTPQSTLTLTNYTVTASGPFGSSTSTFKMDLREILVARSPDGDVILNTSEDSRSIHATNVPSGQVISLRFFWSAASTVQALSCEGLEIPFYAKNETLSLKIPALSSNRFYQGICQADGLTFNLSVAALASRVEVASGLLKLESAQGDSSMNPIFSSDGNYIYFLSKKQQKAEDASITSLYFIHQLNLKTGQSRVINRNWDFRGLNLSPDDKFLGYGSSRFVTGTGNVLKYYVADVSVVTITPVEIHTSTSTSPT